MGSHGPPPYWPDGGLGSDAAQPPSSELRARNLHRSVRQILIAAGLALAVALLLTAASIRMFTRLGFGQEIRDDAPKSHQRKRGTPTMGGLAILTAIWASYLGTNLVGLMFW
jgi:UDP-N-acetylmuramyl pentapeptide phosphotransferase/UDP-N-acetylglucosamine-1-phosphate transferase